MEYGYARDKIEIHSDAINGMQHIMGELKAVIKAVVFAILLELKKITIVYGYLGVEKL